MAAPAAEPSALSLPPVPLPRYGEAALADLVPSLFSALGARDFANPLGVAPAAVACIFVVDGLGWELVAAHPGEAPFLNASGGGPLTAGFPATTATSLASLGTGRPPGEHGLVGYTMLLPGEETALNNLSWAPYGLQPDGGQGGGGFLHPQVPEEVQPEATAFERAAAQGIATTLVGPRQHAHSGMTRAVLRGGSYRTAFTLPDLVAVTAEVLAEPGPQLVYSYTPDLDLVGHIRGVDSEAWRLQLAEVDQAAQALAERLPAGGLLVVTGDHGMVDLATRDHVDVGDVPALMQGVHLLGGEARARHVYAHPGAAGDVLDTWRSVLGDRMWVVAGDEAVAAGWFGPTVSDRIRPRIGDVVAAAYGNVGVMQRAVDPAHARLVGHHGSMTAREQLVPLITARR
ncbi:MAG TPA: nucleotide pyrophosphatase/phosphodiesterase family protein [Candidatus Dormibacteraeota bacterium]|nr:nucleotide pyrophosphatase/phosphodiesterase family protein [Candidatus Dormibacteraeota bacterium]